MIDDWRIHEPALTWKALEHLMKFVGKDLLFSIRGKAVKNARSESLEIRGNLLGGDFTFKITFPGGERH